MSDTDERLTRIESRIEHIESILAKAEQAILPILANPGRLLGKAFGGK